jgi:ribosomal protein S15P/S13E
MTNPTPDYSAKFRFDSTSIGEAQHTIVRLSATGNDSCPANAFLSLEAAEAVGDSMNKPLKAAPSSIVKKSAAGGVDKRRKVSFLVDDKDRLVEDLHEYPFPSVPDEDIWWTEDELDQLLTEAMLVAEHFTTKRKDWQNKVKLVLKGCACGKDKNGQQVKLKASDLDFVVDCEARGLELYIHPIFQKNREKAIKGVVKIQAEYNASEEKKGKKDPELRLKVLKAQSLKLTQTARTMAKTLADADKRAASGDAEHIHAMTTQDSFSRVEDITPSEELETPSAELNLGDETEQDYNPARRPRVHSPRRGSLRTTGLRELHSQNFKQGGIGSLQATLTKFGEDQP